MRFARSPRHESFQWTPRKDERAREDAKSLRLKLFANMPVQESLLEGAFA